MRRAAAEEAALVEKRSELSARLEAVDAGEVGTARDVEHRPVVADHGALGESEAVALPRLEVTRVVRRRELDSSSAELRVDDYIIDDDGDCRAVDGVGRPQLACCGARREGVPWSYNLSKITGGSSQIVSRVRTKCQR